MHSVADLWNGRVALKRIFWEYAIVYGSIANLVVTFAALAALTSGLPIVVALLLHILPVPYNLVMVVGVWRSAAGYRGTAVWPALARASILVWAAVATFA
jgi:hypothetical protein